MFDLPPAKRQRGGAPAAVGGAAATIGHSSSWMDCESLSCVPAPGSMAMIPPGQPSPTCAAYYYPAYGNSSSSAHTVNSSSGDVYCKTPVSSELTTELFFDRFAKEIVHRFGFVLGDQLPLGDGMTAMDAKRRREILKKRVRVGCNETTRILEDAVAKQGPVPSFVVLAGDLSPPTMLVQIPTVCRQLGVPCLILRPTAGQQQQQPSLQLGQLLGTHHVSTLTFMPYEEAALGLAPLAHLGSSANDREIHFVVDSFVQYCVGKALQHQAEMAKALSWSG